MEQDSKNIHKLIFFDGICHLCNGFVDFLLSCERDPLFYFAPLQGVTAAKYLSPEQIQKLDSVVLWDQGVTYEKSAAVLKILTGLGGVYRVFALGWLLPAFLRDGLYDFIARHRYSWFGKRDSCRLPTSEEKTYLLP